MARRKGHDEQVDPFTAGEPTLPWDEPGALSGLFGGDADEPCAFDEGPYDGPTKDPDAYDAPGRDGDGGALRPRAEETRRRRPSRAERVSEHRAREAAPRDKKTHSRPFGFMRAALIFFVSINLLPIAIDIVTQVVSSIGASAPEEPPVISDAPESPSFEEADVEPEIDRSSLDADELACVEACESYLQSVADGHGPERTALIDAFERDVLNTTGYTCEDLGIDAESHADRVLSDLDYRITSCYPRPDEGTASLYLYAWCPDTSDAISQAGQSIVSYLDERGIHDGQPMRPLADDERAETSRLFSEAVENAGSPSESFLGFDLTLEDGAWSLDLEQARYQLGFSLGY